MHIFSKKKTTEKCKTFKFTMVQFHSDFQSKYLCFRKCECLQEIDYILIRRLSFAIYELLHWIHFESFHVTPVIILIAFIDTFVWSMTNLLLDISSSIFVVIILKLAWNKKRINKWIDKVRHKNVLIFVKLSSASP